MPRKPAGRKPATKTAPLGFEAQLWAAADALAAIGPANPSLGDLNPRAHHVCLERSA